jgi:hypothetical protein
VKLFGARQRKEGAEDLLVNRLQISTPHGPNPLSLIPKVLNHDPIRVGVMIMTAINKARLIAAIALYDWSDPAGFTYICVQTTL